MKLKLDYDDAITVWLNGTKIYESAESPTFDENNYANNFDKLATTQHDPAGDMALVPSYTEHYVTSYLSSLNDGSNLLVIANWTGTAITSTDLVAAVRLELGITTPGPNLVQQKTNYTTYGTPVTSFTTTLDSEATAGNLIVAGIAIDKHSDAITAIPTDFTLVHKSAEAAGDVSSGAMAYKIATGGETDFTWEWTTAEDATAWVGEFSGLAVSDVFDVSAENESYLQTATNSISTGTTDTTSQADELAIAMFIADSGNSVGSSRTWTNDFTEIAEETGTSGSPYINVATKTLTLAGTVESTCSHDGSDESYAVIATFKATAANQTPTVTSVIITPSPTITLDADTTTTVTISATITDNDDCEDVFDNGTITAVFYDANAVDDSCSQNDNNCYPNITLTEVGNSCDTGTSDPTGDASGTVDVWFHANPGANWTAKVTATDAASNSGSNTSTVEIGAVIAFKLDIDKINYGTVDPNQVSAQQAVLITTTGNVAIDVQLSGTNMTWSTNEILVGQQHYDLDSGIAWESMDGDGTNGTLTGTPDCVELASGKPLAHPSDAYDYIYWKLKVPEGKPAGGPYSNTNNYFDVVSDTSCQ